MALKQSKARKIHLQHTYSMPPGTPHHSTSWALWGSMCEPGGECVSMEKGVCVDRSNVCVWGGEGMRDPLRVSGIMENVSSLSDEETTT